MTPSRRIQSRIESIESSIERMKQLWTATLLEQELAGLGLDVVDVLDAERLDRDDLFLAQIGAVLRVVERERLEQLAAACSPPTKPISSAKRARSEPIEMLTSCMSWRSGRGSYLRVRRE